MTRHLDSSTIKEIQKKARWELWYLWLDPVVYVSLSLYLIGHIGQHHSVWEGATQKHIFQDKRITGDHLGDRLQPGGVGGTWKMLLKITISYKFWNQSFISSQYSRYTLFVKLSSQESVSWLYWVFMIFVFLWCINQFAIIVIIIGTFNSILLWDFKLLECIDYLAYFVSPDIPKHNIKDPGSVQCIFNSGFHNFSITDILGQIIFCL